MKDHPTKTVGLEPTTSDGDEEAKTGDFEPMTEEEGETFGAEHDHH